MSAAGEGRGRDLATRIVADARAVAEAGGGALAETGTLALALGVTLGFVDAPMPRLVTLPDWTA